MIPELGHFLLILSFSFALLQSGCLVSVVLRPDSNIYPVCRSAVICSSSALFASFGILVYAFISNDFSVAYVANHSNTQLPLIFRICALWGAHEGSLILWVTVLSLWSLALLKGGHELPERLQVQVLGVLGAIAVGFLLFLLTTSNPFERLLLKIPANGNDLNPLLQDPGLAIHPPMLYMGYVGFAIPFAFAIAALINGTFNKNWARWCRPWAMTAWSFLTFGIILGSWWAYRVLGWGGWWFWDPVENASFMPWLAGTALVHSLAVTAKRNYFKSWTVFLALLAFCLSLLGTFLVRSGILVSVHAFAVDPSRGLFMLSFLALTMVTSMLLFIWRGPGLATRPHFLWLSRETFLMCNNLLLLIAFATVLLGTLYPLVLDILKLGKISVGPPYFNSIFLPLMSLILLLMGVGPLTAWQQCDRVMLLKKLTTSAVIAASLSSTIYFVYFTQAHRLAWFGLFLIFWSLAATTQYFLHFKKLKNQRYSIPMVLAHLGVVICAIGIIMTSALSEKKELVIKPGQIKTIGPYNVELNRVEPITGPNYHGIKTIFDVYYKKQPVGSLSPEKHIFNVSNISMSRPAVRARPTSDLYLALGEPLETGGWSIRLYYKPFVRWIWLGGLLMMLGGFAAVINGVIANRRLRTDG